MRFLNLCAANTDRQGAFTRSVEKHDIPKWLIDIRHDVAHAHKLPSKDILKVGLQTALRWLKERYWEQQFELVQDYEVYEEHFGLEIIEVIKLYARLILNIHNQNDEVLSGAYMNKLSNLVKRKYKVRPDQLDANTIKSVLEETIRQLLSDPNNQTAMEKNVEVLVSNDFMLGVMPELDSTRIPSSFRDIWIDLLDILNDYNLLIPLLGKLYQFTGDSLMSSPLRNVASLWIDEIFKGLISKKYVKKEENMSEGEIERKIKFKSLNQVPVEEVQTFEDMVLNSPNEYVFNYLESMLCYGGKNEDYIEETRKLLSKLLSKQNMSWDNSLATVDDLPEIDDVPEVPVIKTEPPVEEIEVATTRWTLLTDTKEFRGCPLGVLPHQHGDSNPVLLF
ncbi:unnamed protein product [Acanthoscelides obtectus]|nr:unnamed protein product [Acanthoscelides obtectus]CAK1676193.1 hypothetical protein AOBTE_LOCUS30640 [Acanthoscelides obtectus]